MIDCLQPARRRRISSPPTRPCRRAEQSSAAQRSAWCRRSRLGAEQAINNSERQKKQNDQRVNNKLRTGNNSSSRDGGRRGSETFPKRIDRIFNNKNRHDWQGGGFWEEEEVVVVVCRIQVAYSKTRAGAARTRGTDRVAVAACPRNRCATTGRKAVKRVKQA